MRRQVVIHHSIEIETINHVRRWITISFLALSHHWEIWNTWSYIYFSRVECIGCHDVTIKLFLFFNQNTANCFCRINWLVWIRKSMSNWNKIYVSRPFALRRNRIEISSLISWLFQFRFLCFCLWLTATRIEYFHERSPKPLFIRGEGFTKRNESNINEVIDDNIVDFSMKVIVLHYNKLLLFDPALSFSQHSFSYFMIKISFFLCHWTTAHGNIGGFLH